MALRSKNWALTLALCLSQSTLVVGQAPTDMRAAPETKGAAATQISQQTNSQNPSWLVRDPWSGRVFQQQLVDVTVPVTRWEAKSAVQTVYEPTTTSILQQQSQTLFVPQTQMVMRPRTKGWWNPWRTPVQTYEYVPVTQWVPRTQAVAIPVPTQQWVPRILNVVTYQPVQTNEIRKQLVQQELPQPNLTPNTSPRQFAYLPQPQKVPGTLWGSTETEKVSGNFVPNATASFGLAMRPVKPTGMPATVLPGTYSAPLQSHGRSNVAIRDTLQTGLQPTVLR